MRGYMSCAKVKPIDGWPTGSRPLSQRWFTSFSAFRFEGFINARRESSLSQNRQMPTGVRWKHDVIIAWVGCDEFVNGSLRAGGEVAVVMHHDSSPRRHALMEKLQCHVDRIVEVAIKKAEADLRRHFCGIKRLLDEAR